MTEGGICETLMSARSWATQRTLLSRAPAELPWICAGVLSSDFYIFLPYIHTGLNSPHSKHCFAYVGCKHAVLLICMKVPGYGRETARHLIFEGILRPFEFTVDAAIIV